MQTEPGLGGGLEQAALNQGRCARIFREAKKAGERVVPSYSRRTVLCIVDAPWLEVAASYCSRHCL